MLGRRADPARQVVRRTADYLAVGEPTTTTASLGNAVVCARPDAIDGAVSLDPDGPLPALQKALRSLDGKFSLLAAGASTAVLATDALGCGPAFYAERNGSVYVASQPRPPRPAPGGRRHARSGRRRRCRRRQCLGRRAVAVRTSPSPAGRSVRSDRPRLRPGPGRELRQRRGDLRGRPRGPRLPGRGDEADPHSRGSKRSASTRSSSLQGRTPGSSPPPATAAAQPDPRADVRRLALHGPAQGRGGRREALGLQHRLIGPLRLRPEQYADPIIVRGQAAADSRSPSTSPAPGRREGTRRS